MLDVHFTSWKRKKYIEVNTIEKKQKEENNIK